MDLGQVCLLLAAGLAAGSVNALAGGGSLITFPALVTIGLPPVTANVTNSISVCPGYLAAVAASRADLAGQRRRALSLTPVAVLGTACGAALLLLTPAAAFEAVVPFLVIGAAQVLAFQTQIRKLVGHPHSMSPRRRNLSLQLLAGIGCVYGGYFGAALGVMMVACLALVLDETLARISALKNSVSATVGVVTIVIYSAFAPVEWAAVAVVAPSTLVGGYLGAKLARVLPQKVLRAFIVTFGLVIGVYLYLFK
ncbi:MAG: sulfite exporter TauE/SafE family protein [Stackebrandtia sp.]